VGDVARANIMALSQGDGEVFNVGTGVSTSLNEVVKRFNEIAGYENKVEYGPEREGDIKHSYFNNGKIRRVLGWQPEVTLEEGLRKTYEYYQDIYRKMDKEM
jgi:UDP-glucose 4-epimerase